jgi:hypothetical protein
MAAEVAVAESCRWYRNASSAPVGDTRAIKKYDCQNRRTERVGDLRSATGGQVQVPMVVKNTDAPTDNLIGTTATLLPSGNLSVLSR